MKKITLILLAVFSTSIVLLSQSFAPQGYTYQGVARDPQGIVMAVQLLQVHVSIISGTPNGPVQYVETHAPTTNQFGLFTITVGQGTPSGGLTSFPLINWGSGAHYMKVEVNFGSGLENMGITQIWSVPYALYAKRAFVADSIAGQNVGFPAGVIVMWSGNPSTIPQGWALCNGSNGTPDLRGRFIAGYDPNDADYNTVGNTGGQKSNNATHQVTIDPPPQTFTSAQSNAPRYGSLSSNTNGDVRYYNHTHDVTVDISSFNVTTGPPSDPENRPPYYVLAYIMKL